jgi:cell division protein FtsB
VAKIPPIKPSIDIGKVVSVIRGIQNIQNIEQFNAQRPQFVQAVTDLQTHLTETQAQIDNLNGTISQNQTNIANLQSQNASLTQDNVKMQATIDDLNKRLAGLVNPPPTANTIDLATSLKGVFDAIQQQARQQAEGGAATTIRSMDFAIKTQVTVQPDSTGKFQTVLRLPTPETPIDPDQLSTLSLSFGSIPGATPSRAPISPSPTPVVPPTQSPTPPPTTVPAPGSTERPAVGSRSRRPAKQESRKARSPSRSKS